MNGPGEQEQTAQSMVGDDGGLIPACFLEKHARWRAVSEPSWESTVNTHTGWRNFYQVCHKGAQL